MVKFWENVKKLLQHKPQAVLQLIACLVVCVFIKLQKNGFLVLAGTFLLSIVWNLVMMTKSFSLFN